MSCFPIFYEKILKQQKRKSEENRSFCEKKGDCLALNQFFEKSFKKAIDKTGEA